MTWVKWIVAALIAALFISPVNAEANTGDWTVDIQPYIFLPLGLSGESIVDGGAVDLDLGFDELTEALNYAFSMRIEAWHKNKWGFVVDGMVMDLGVGFGGEFPNESPPPPTIGADFDVSIREQSFDFFGAYRIAKENISYDFLGGLRLVQLKQTIDIEPRNLPMIIPSLGGTENWWELAFGARIAWEFSEKWVLVGRGDIGGFGLGDGSDLTWNLLAGIGYQPWEHAALRLGYRVYSIDYETGSGADKFAFDATMHGPWLGMSFIF